MQLIVLVIDATTLHRSQITPEYLTGFEGKLIRIRVRHERLIWLLVNATHFD